MSVAEAKLEYRTPEHKFGPGSRFKTFITHSRPAIPKQGDECTPQEVPKEESVVPVSQEKGRLRRWTASHSFSGSVLLSWERTSTTMGPRKPFKVPIPGRHKNYWHLAHAEGWLSTPPH